MLRLNRRDRVVDSTGRDVLTVIRGTAQVELASKFFHVVRYVGAKPSREAILAALDATHWRRAAAAKELNVSRVTLWKWMVDLDLCDAIPTIPSE